MKVVLLLLATILFSGCLSMQTRLDRFDSGASTETSLDFRRERMVQEFRDARNELGLKSVNLTGDHQALIAQRVRLNKQEKNFRTETEKQQYYQYKPYIRGDRLRSAFLNLPSVEKREAWARRMGLNRRLTTNSPYEKAAIEQNDIFLGMSKKAVRESWGDPENVEVAGSAIYGNERWNYSTYVTSADGFSEENRIIYFEGGRVVGWNKR